AHGGILAAALFAPGLSLDVFNAVRDGNDDVATAAQARLTPLGAKIIAELGVPGVKAAMDAVGMRGGPVRSPLMPVNSEQRTVIQQLLRSAELATAAEVER